MLLRNLKLMLNFFTLVASFFILGGSILSASDFNHNTGFALKSDLADKATITSCPTCQSAGVAIGF